MIMIKLGKHNEALQMLNYSPEEVVIYKGAKNKETLQCLAEFATLLEEAGDLKQAFKFYKEAYDMSNKKLGEKSEFTKEMLLRLSLLKDRVSMKN